MNHFAPSAKIEHGLKKRERKKKGKSWREGRKRNRMKKSSGALNLQQGTGAVLD